MHVLRSITLGFFLALIVSGSMGRDASPSASACSVPEVRQFDFWVGEWTLTWGEEGRGANTIRRILDGCVIEENFEGEMPSGMFRGKSVSVYDTTRGRWLQTWVDNQGGYLDFSGGLDGGRMILQRTTERNGKPLLQRMVWYDIQDDHLTWNWEKSEDGGTTWTTLWKITYRRKE